jgi:hypothetical protein
MPIPDNPIQTNAIIQGTFDLIKSAMRLIGVTAPGETPTIAEANDSLKVLNQMIDAWNADRLAIFTTGSEDFPFVAGQQTYTMGPGGDFNTQRPARIENMSAILLEDESNPVEIPIAMYTVEEWQQQIPVKQVDSSFPQICYDEGGFPLRRLNFWPIPTQANAARIYSWQALGAATSLQAVLSYPAGYAQAIRFNLAVLLSAEFAAPVSAVVQSVAVESLARVKSMNIPQLNLQSDLIASPAGYNYKADLFGIGL